MLVNSFFFYFLEIYVLGGFFFVLSILTWFKVFKKSLKLNVLFGKVVFLVLLTSFFLINYMYFFNDFFLIYYNYWFLYFLKNIILFFLLVFIVISLNYFFFFKESYVLPDFYLLLFVFFFVNISLISTNNIVLFYILLEIQNLIFFIFAALIRNRWFVVESAFRYFLVSGFSTMMFLLSLSLFWGLTGLFDFSMYYIFFENLYYLEFMYIFFFFSLLFFFCSFSLKLGLFPFHWWLVDVYEGVPLLITFFFMVIPKIFLIFVFVKFMYINFFFSLYYLSYIYIFFILISMFWSLLKALYQFSIIRFLVYSSIFNMGFIYIGLFSYTVYSMISVFIYLFIYLFNSICLFFILLSLNLKKFNSSFSFVKSLFDLSFFFNSRKKNLIYIIFIFVVNIFSIAGIPPLLGFFGKFFILWNYIYSDSIVLLLLVLIISVLGSFYYLRFIRFFIFNNRNKEFVNVYLNLGFMKEYLLSFFFFFQIFGFFFIFDFFVFFLVYFF